MEKLLIGSLGFIAGVALNGNETQAAHLYLESHDMNQYFVKSGNVEQFTLDFKPYQNENSGGLNGWGPATSLFREIEQEWGGPIYTGPHGDFLSAAGRTHEVYPEYTSELGTVVEESDGYLNISETYGLQAKVSSENTKQLTIQSKDNNFTNTTLGYGIAFETGMLMNDHYRYTLKGEAAFVEGAADSEFRVVTSSFAGKGHAGVIAAIADNYTSPCFKEFSVPIDKGYMLSGLYGIFLGVHSDDSSISTKYSYRNIRLERERVVSLNEASYEELQLLIGIGTVLAQRIIDYREAGNWFESIDDLVNIKGIGTATVSKIKEQNIAVLGYTTG